jgi:hypothetical protein
MTDWSDPITYAAIVGAVTGVAGTALGVLRLRHDIQESTEQRQEAARDLFFHVHDADSSFTQNRLRLGLGIQITNPSSISVSVIHVSLFLRFGEGKEEELWALEATRRGTQGPWVLGDELVGEDTLSVPINIAAHESVRGTIYFATYDNLVDKQPTSAQAFLEIRDSRGRIVRDRVLPLG